VIAFLLLVLAANKLLMGDAVDFFMGYSIGAVNTIVKAISKITVVAIFQKYPIVSSPIPTQQLKPLLTLKISPFISLVLLRLSTDPF
jgi:NitT/TauT family transport system substrate-binding protein